MTRKLTANLSIIFVFCLILFDVSTVELNPYKAPSLLALGSGVESVGGFCGAVTN